MNVGWHSRQYVAVARPSDLLSTFKRWKDKPINMSGLEQCMITVVVISSEVILTAHMSVPDCNVNTGIEPFPWWRRNLISIIYIRSRSENKHIV